MNTEDPAETFPQIFTKICARSSCGAFFEVTVMPGQEPATYCSPTCRKKASRDRRVARCPVGCGREILRPGAVVCGPCWGIAAGMCLGKRRLTERRARDVAERREYVAYWCRCCGWWHNGHPVDDGAGLVAQVGQILEGMRSARGQIWVNGLIESWDPEVRDRKEWARNRRPPAGTEGQA